MGRNLSVLFSSEIIFAIVETMTFDLKLLPNPPTNILFGSSWTRPGRVRGGYGYGFTCSFLCKKKFMLTKLKILNDKLLKYSHSFNLFNPQPRICKRTLKCVSSAGSAGDGRHRIRQKLLILKICLVSKFHVNIQLIWSK